MFEKVCNESNRPDDESGLLLSIRITAEVPIKDSVID
jgi:hypothetical protein